MSENSYLRHFSAQVSQMVFLAYLTVLRLITTIWVEIAEISAHNKLSLFLYHFLQLFQFQCTSITIRVLTLFQFYGLLELY